MAKNALGKGFEALLQENSISDETDNIGRLKSSNPENSLNLPANIKMEEDGSLWVDPALLIPNPKQPRLEFDPKKMDELSDSIKINGILQPIIIEDSGNGNFYIIAGERRTRAAKMAGLTKVPVQLRKFDEQQKLEMALIENIQRADLNPIEEATAYYNLIQMGDLSQDEVAKRVGKARATVANSIRLLRLPEDIKKALSNGQISSGHARALLMVKTDSEMHILFGKIVGQGISVREAEEEAKKLNDGSRAASKNKKKVQQKKDADVLSFEQDLKNLFGTKSVNLKGDINKGSIVIGFDSKKDFDRIYDVLMSKR